MTEKSVGTLSPWEVVRENPRLVLEVPEWATGNEAGS